MQHLYELRSWVAALIQAESEISLSPRDHIEPPNCDDTSFECRMVSIV